MAASIVRTFPAVLQNGVLPGAQARGNPSRALPVHSGNETPVFQQRLLKLPDVSVRHIRGKAAVPDRQGGSGPRRLADNGTGSHHARGARCV